MGMDDIRTATLDDLAPCVDLLGTLFSQEKEFSPDPLCQEKGLELILCNPRTGRVFVYEAEGVVKGMVILLFTVSTALGKKVAILEDLIISPDARGSSAGTRLVGHAIEFAVREGFARITLLTDDDNESAQRFYRKCGFTKSDMIVFRKLLNAAK
jgi:ribosomal protein S18 acetylase RimI-like enzyme